jgi:hypothetical protein
MAVALSIASPKMDWRWLARLRICVDVSCDIFLCPSGDIVSVGISRESKSERVMAFASVVAEYESTAT